MALDPMYFGSDFLDIYNGTWTTLPNNTQGGPGNDKMLFTRGGLVIAGNGGNDHITIQGGLINTVYGNAGSDQIYGGSGFDTIFGGDGNDFIQGNAGNDILNGGAGMDTLSYESATGGGITLTLNASGGVNLGQFLPGSSNAGTDTIGGGFENVVGTNQNDTITGNSVANVLIGLGGNDTLNGMGGNDTLNGDDGNDTLNGGDGGDQLGGGDGDDVLIGGAGFDSFRGDDGFDTVDYSSSGAGVFIRFDGSPSGGDAEGDGIDLTIEKIIGSSFRDSLQEITNSA